VLESMAWMDALKRLRNFLCFLPQLNVGEVAIRWQNTCQ